MHLMYYQDESGKRVYTLKVSWHVALLVLFSIVWGFRFISEDFFIYPVSRRISSTSWNRNLLVRVFFFVWSGFVNWFDWFFFCDYDRTDDVPVCLFVCFCLDHLFHRRWHQMAKQRSRLTQLASLLTTSSPKSVLSASGGLVFSQHNNHHPSIETTFPKEP